MKPYIGGHISISKGLVEAAEITKKYNGNALQIFLSSPRQNKAKYKDDSEYAKLKKYIQKNDMKLYVHSSYLLNFCKDWDHCSSWVNMLITEIKYCYLSGAKGIVLHMGKSLDLTIEEAYNNMFCSLIYVLKKTDKYKSVKILLETPAGQGTEICHKLEDFAKFYNKFSKVKKKYSDRIGLCVDTCHIFVAGYNIKDSNELKKYVNKFDKLIGIKNIDLIHFNDSKRKCGDRVDRHENIGKGYIGEKALEIIGKYFIKKNIPLILETPGKGYEWEIKMLRKY